MPDLTVSNAHGRSLNTLTFSRTSRTPEPSGRVCCMSPPSPKAVLTYREIFEIASGPGLTDQQRHDILQIRVVGGGPTGVEYAAELHDFVTSDVVRMYPQLKDKISITLYDVAPGILMSFDA